MVEMLNESEYKYEVTIRRGEALEFLTVAGFLITMFSLFYSIIQGKKNA